MSKIIIVSGPAGVGKSAACKKFAENAEGIWAYIDQDEIRNFIYAGFKYPTGIWTEDVKTQWDVAHRITVDIIKRYQESNINCIIDGFAPNLKSLEHGFKEYLEGIDFKLIVIMPSLEVTLLRNSQRIGSARLEDHQIEKLYSRFNNFIGSYEANVIDSTSLSVDEVVGELTKFSDTV